MDSRPMSCGSQLLLWGSREMTPLNLSVKPGQLIIPTSWLMALTHRALGPFRPPQNPDPTSPSPRLHPKSTAVGSGPMAISLFTLLSEDLWSVLGPAHLDFLRPGAKERNAYPPCFRARGGHDSPRESARPRCGSCRYSGRVLRESDPCVPSPAFGLNQSWF